MYFAVLAPLKNVICHYTVMSNHSLTVFHCFIIGCLPDHTGGLITEQLITGYNLRLNLEVEGELTVFQKV